MIAHRPQVVRVSVEAVHEDNHMDTTGGRRRRRRRRAGIRAGGGGGGGACLCTRGLFGRRPRKGVARLRSRQSVPLACASGALLLKEDRLLICAPGAVTHRRRLSDSDNAPSRAQRFVHECDGLLVAKVSAVFEVAYLAKDRLAEAGDSHAGVLGA